MEPVCELNNFSVLTTVESMAKIRPVKCTMGVPKIMSSVLYFAEIVQFMHKTTSTQVNISSTRSLASVQSVSVHRFIAYSLD